MPTAQREWASQPVCKTGLQVITPESSWANAPQLATGDEQSDANGSERSSLRKRGCFEHDGIYDHGMRQQQGRMPSTGYT